MAGFSKNFSLQLDSDLIDRLMQYSNENACDTSYVVDEALFSFFQREDRMVSQLMDGYVNMADINEEISNAFSVCEQEVDRQV
ncbi:antitoxin [Bombilactobacillus folatiphilus]|uniref:Antitoxin n=1 Tax=Bombilactobacillus folatiphilus TaxID=2923362 RepID=A0ABY4P9G8_9LACO|nr:antitoxin [Bombilactobacillus folatiphilus]UQS82322.1 antitoxin [Bombilactobacillus folatiphilus]